MLHIAHHILHERHTIFPTCLHPPQHQFCRYECPLWGKPIPKVPVYPTYMVETMRAPKDERAWRTCVENAHTHVCNNIVITLKILSIYLFRRNHVTHKYWHIVKFSSSLHVFNQLSCAAQNVFILLFPVLQGCTPD